LMKSGRFMPVTERGASKTVTARGVPEKKRATRGEAVIALRGNDKVVSVVLPAGRVG